MRRSLTPTVRYSSEKYLKKIPTGLFHPECGWIIDTQSVPTSAMRPIGEWFAQHKIPTIAGSLTWARWFPLNIGVDADALSEKVIMPILSRILIDKQPPEQNNGLP